MSLSCYCGEDADWFYEPIDEYATLQTKRSRKCASCKRPIAVGALSQRFRCWRYPKNDIEKRIHPEEVPLADKFMCEECADLYWSLDELGYCINLGDNMRQLVREYAELRARGADDD